MPLSRCTTLALASIFATGLAAAPEVGSIKAQSQSQFAVFMNAGTCDVTVTAIDMEATAGYIRANLSDGFKWKDGSFYLATSRSKAPGAGLDSITVPKGKRIYVEFCGIANPDKAKATLEPFVFFNRLRVIPKSDERSVDVLANMLWETTADGINVNRIDLGYVSRFGTPEFEADKDCVWVLGGEVKLDGHKKDRGALTFNYKKK